jgi:signal peptidase I
VNRKTIFLAAVCAGLIGCNGASNATSGDRVLVAKCLYDTNAMAPHRYEVVVFKYPVTPIEKNTPKNYIKRLIGLPGEIIAIFFGRLYHWAPQNGEEIPYRKEDEGGDPNNLWNMHSGKVHDTDPFASELFRQGKFEILRKPPDILLALRRIVFDNDFQPKDLEGMVAPRWDTARTKGWKASDDKTVLSHKGDTELIDWVRYQHLVVERSADEPVAGGVAIKPQLITDRMGYNSALLRDKAPPFVERDKAPPPVESDMTPGANWVGDLMLECNVEIQRPQGELVLELSKGINRFQARWNLADGTCTLYRIFSDREEKLESKPTRLKSTGSYLVRFGNIDARLIVWVDRELPFDEGVAYSPPEVRAPGEKISEEDLLKRRGPTENDLQPASIGSKGAAVTIKHLRLWRDTYYTTNPQGPDHGQANFMARDVWADPGRWGPLQNLPLRTIYVQPNHYLCLGDNSTASSDSRDWGLVPQRLLLGRALAVYYPIHRLGPIR